MTPINLPIDPSIARCLAHGDRPGEWCLRRNDCACHETIKHDREAAPTIVYRKCHGDNYVAHLPLSGFPETDDSE